MPAAGDIVTIRRRPGRWVVHSKAIGAIPSGRMWNVIRAGSEPRAHLLVRDRTITVRASPTFDPLMIVRYERQSAIVIEDLGGVVRIAFDRRTALRGGGHISWPFRETRVQRSTLVLENMGALLQEEVG
jgi:hypothetical protein